MKPNPKTILLWTLVSALFVSFVAGFEHESDRTVLADTKRFAELLEVHLWNMDAITAQEYIGVIGQFGDYTNIEILQNDKTVFARSSQQKSYWKLDDLLLTLGLQSEETLQIPMSYRNEPIGLFLATWRNRNVYTYLNVLLLLILIVSVARYTGTIAGHDREIEEREAAEDALRISSTKLVQAQAEAEQANRLKTDFLANMSHEIRTPLNVILGYTSLVEKFSREHLPEKRTIYFEYIKKASHRLMDTIQKIVDISRFHIEDFPFETEPLLLNETVQQCVAELKILADQKNIRLTYTPPDAECWINFDAYAFNQALSNIVENAIKYTEKGSVNVTLVQKESDIVIQVQDTGIGIGDEYLPYIFDEFSQEKGGYSRPFEGTGLGMALVKKFLDYGGGTVEIESEKDKETIITLSWPSIQAPETSNQAFAEEKPSTDTRSTVERKAVLVIEDDPSTQSFMQTALGDDYDVFVASCGSEADEILVNTTPALILMDLSLKDGEDGTALTKKIRSRQEFAHIPIVALTAHALDIDRDNALAAGCNDYLSKPCPLNKLMETVNTYTRQLET